jgi:hypothetical protein
VKVVQTVARIKIKFLEQFVAFEFSFSSLSYVGSGDLRQMSEYSILPREQYHSCILKSAFLHPEKEL